MEPRRALLGIAPDEVFGVIQARRLALGAVEELQQIAELIAAGARGGDQHVDPGPVQLRARNRRHADDPAVGVILDAHPHQSQRHCGVDAVGADGFARPEDDGDLARPAAMPPGFALQQFVGQLAAQRHRFGGRDQRRVEGVEIASDRQHVGIAHRIAGRTGSDETAVKRPQQCGDFVGSRPAQIGCRGGAPRFGKQRGHGGDLRLRRRDAEGVQPERRGAFPLFRILFKFFPPVAAMIEMQTLGQAVLTGKLQQRGFALRLDCGIGAAAVAEALPELAEKRILRRNPEKRREVVDHHRRGAALGDDAFADAVGDVRINFDDIAAHGPRRAGGA
ncbi:hypothetical protein SDC9_116481 [bioreactor metagenome]|uniref:Uncharacterized protein n=1 Tax=bioreactor metagenome TaxID=1076179 RepID=A0A645BVL2_9ZZZZ